MDDGSNQSQSCSLQTCPWHRCMDNLTEESKKTALDGCTAADVSHILRHFLERRKGSLSGASALPADAGRDAAHSDGEGKGSPAVSGHGSDSSSPIAAHERPTSPEPQPETPEQTHDARGGCQGPAPGTRDGRRAGGSGQMGLPPHAESGEWRDHTDLQRIQTDRHEGSHPVVPMQMGLPPHAENGEWRDHTDLQRIPADRPEVSHPVVPMQTASLLSGSYAPNMFPRFIQPGLLTQQTYPPPVLPYQGGALPGGVMQGMYPRLRTNYAEYLLMLTTALNRSPSVASDGLDLPWARGVILRVSDRFDPYIVGIVPC